MFWKKKPAEDMPAEEAGEAQPDNKNVLIPLEQMTPREDTEPEGEDSQNEYVWLTLKCGDRHGYVDCGILFKMLVPRWKADEIFRGSGVLKCPNCESYGSSLITTTGELGFCGEETSIGELTFKCDRLRGHKGRHEHNWDRPSDTVKRATYTWLDEGAEEEEDL